MVEGRGLSKATVRVQATESGFVLLIDDQQHPDFWMHVFISEDVAFAWARFATSEASAE